MSFTLALKSHNEVEGFGSDENGDFSWSGTIDSNGQAVLVKSYTDYSINYKGIA